MQFMCECVCVDCANALLMCLRCLMLTLSGPVELMFYCRLDLHCGECYVGCLQS